ncbi:MAG: hypothetical protein PHP93_09160, partial [Kiritimatiellales bacterium]|nr:hypothetical protein [Kiritimatiellales bacterium]
MRSKATTQTSGLAAANIPTWWKMVDPATGYLPHPVWVGGEMYVDTYATSESVSYLLMTAYDGYVMSNGSGQYATLIKKALDTFGKTINNSRKNNLQMPWLVDNGTQAPVDSTSASDGDALVLSLLMQMRDAGVFDSSDFNGWTLKINGKNYSTDELITVLHKDYVDTEVYNANKDGKPPFYVIGVGDGYSDASWPQASGKDGRKLVMVNTSYNIWVDPAGNEALEQAQINQLRVILASQTWNLDGSDGTRSDVSMGAFPGWTDVSGTGAKFSMSSKMTQKTVTVDGQEFTFWVLDQEDGAGFDLSQERLESKGLVSYQNFEGHRMLVFAVDVQQRVLAKQLNYEKTGDPAYVLTDAEREAYSLAEKIIQNYMAFQHIVLLTQGEGAIANDAYYITDNDYGDLGDDVDVSTSVPGQKHAYASDTKGGVVAAHLMAAMACGDIELIVLYTQQYVDAIGFVDEAFDNAESAFGSAASPLHVYGKDGTLIIYSFGNPYFEGAFITHLLASYPDAVMPRAAVLDDPQAREEEAKAIHIVIFDNDEGSNAAAAANVVVFETTPSQGYEFGYVDFGQGAKLDSNSNVDFTSAWQSVFVKLDQLPGFDANAKIKSIEVTLSDPNGNPIKDTFFLRVQDGQWASAGISEGQFANGKAVISFDGDGKTLAEIGGTFLNILASGTTQDVNITITVTTQSAPQQSAAVADGKGSGALRKVVQSTILFGPVGAVGRVFPRGKNVLEMDAGTLARYVAGTEYFLSGQGSTLEGDELQNEIDRIVARIKSQTEAWAWSKIDGDARAGE